MLRFSWCVQRDGNGRFDGTSRREDGKRAKNKGRSNCYRKSRMHFATTRRRRDSQYRPRSDARCGAARSRFYSGITASPRWTKKEACGRSVVGNPPASTASITGWVNSNWSQAHPERPRRPARKSGACPLRADRLVLLCNPPVLGKASQQVLHAECSSVETLSRPCADRSAWSSPFLAKRVNTTSRS